MRSKKNDSRKNGIRKNVSAKGVRGSNALIDVFPRIAKEGSITIEDAPSSVAQPTTPVTEQSSVVIAQSSVKQGVQPAEPVRPAASTPPKADQGATTKPTAQPATAAEPAPQSTTSTVAISAVPVEIRQQFELMANDLLEMKNRLTEAERLLKHIRMENYNGLVDKFSALSQEMEDMYVSELPSQCSQCYCFFNRQMGIWEFTYDEDVAYEHGSFVMLCMIHEKD